MMLFVFAERMPVYANPPNVRDAMHKEYPLANVTHAIAKRANQSLAMVFSLHTADAVSIKQVRRRCHTFFK